MDPRADVLVALALGLLLTTSSPRGLGVPSLVLDVALQNGQSVRVRDRPVFDQINVVVRDMPAMLEFYRILGLDVADADPGWEQHHRKATSRDGFDIDFDSQPFAQEWNHGWPVGASGSVIGFRVVERSTVDEVFQRLTSAGYRAQQEPYDAFWGARYAIVSDPDGNSVGIMSAADPSRRRRPTPPTS